MDKDGTGMIDFPEFLSMMSLKVILIQPEICNTLQKVRELLWGKLQQMFQQESENAEDEIREAFQVFDGVIFIS